MKYSGKYIIVFALFGMIFMSNSVSGYSQEVNYKAYSLFLYNFMKYIEWPTNDDDFIIGVEGDSPVKKELEILARNKRVKGRKIVLIDVQNPSDALLCNMVYISSRKSNMLKVIIEKVHNNPVLIVGEREGLAKKGADISFVVDDDDTLRFDINKSALNSHNLKISSLLLGLGNPIN